MVCTTLGTNSWKYWKSPAILLSLLERFITQSYTSLSVCCWYYVWDVCIMTKHSLTHFLLKNSKLLQNCVIAWSKFKDKDKEARSMWKKSTGTLLNVSWKSPVNLLGWICRHPVLRTSTCWSNSTQSLNFVIYYSLNLIVDSLSDCDFSWQHFIKKYNMHDINKKTNRKYT